MLFVIGGLAVLALMGAALALIPGPQGRVERVPGESTVTAISVVVAAIAVLIGLLAIGLFLLAV